MALGPGAGAGLLNKLRRLVGRAPYGQLLGSQAKAPRGDLDLKPGELVEVKSRREIEATLDADGRNCGLSFEVEMLEHCGRRYRVAFPIRQIIFEQTSKMVQLNNTVALDGVVCQGLCAKTARGPTISTGARAGCGAWKGNRPAAKRRQSMPAPGRHDYRKLQGGRGRVLHLRLALAASAT